MPTEDSPRSAEPDTVEPSPPAMSPAGTAMGEDRSPVTDPELLGILDGLTADLAGLRRDFDSKIRYDEVKERQFSAMHEELETLRAGVHLRLLQPMFTDLIAMHDDLVEALRAGGFEPNDAAVPQEATILHSFKESILETLLRNGVSSYCVQSDELDRSRQRVIDVARTADRTLDRRVMRRLRAGFEYDGGRVLRPEWVVVYRYTETQEPA